MNEANATPHAELIVELMNPNNPKNEREHAAVREIERLREDQQGVDAVAVLTEEGWTWDGDQWQRPASPAVINMENFVGSGKPVVKMINDSVIAGALFDFMGWLTSRDERLVLSCADEAGPAVDAIKDFAKMRGLSLNEAMVQNWQNTSRKTHELLR